MNKFNTKFLWWTLFIGLGISLFVYAKREFRGNWSNVNYSTPITHTITLTEEWSERFPVNIRANTLRDDLWHEVWVIGAGKNGEDYKYEVPPWKDWGKISWKAPKLTGTGIKFRLIPEKNGSVRQAKFVYSE